MCCPFAAFRPKRGDKYLGHRLVAEASAKYITRSPILHRHSANLPPEQQVPLDLYIARVIHAAKVPDIVPHTALYLLAAISQSCQCRIPQLKSKSDYDLSSPSKLSHIISRAVTRTPFSRVAKSHWDERDIFVGAFYLTILAYKPIFYKEHRKELPFWNMLRVCGIEKEEIGDICSAFNQCITLELRMAIVSMLCNKFVINVLEFDCPFALARQRRLSKAEDENENEKDQKKRMSLKRSISSFWKPKEKATPVEVPEPQRPVDCEPNTAPAGSYFYF